MAETVRYRAQHNHVYGTALIELFRLARSGTTPEFQFGPIGLKAIREQGLVISGEDLSAVTDSLSRVAGLTEVPA